jgi:transcriptional/translational regulatory protein YebC/TACO1
MLDIDPSKPCRIEFHEITKKAVKEALEGAGYPILSAEKDKIPSNTVTLSEADDLKFMGLLIEMLEEDDDVMNVYHNWENCD